MNQAGLGRSLASAACFYLRPQPGPAKWSICLFFRAPELTLRKSRGASREEGEGPTLGRGLCTTGLSLPERRPLHPESWEVWPSCGVSEDRLRQSCLPPGP